MFELVICKGIIKVAERKEVNKNFKKKMSALPRRIIKETQRLMLEPVPGISAVPDESNARYFHVIVTGPEDSPFEGGLFKLELFLPEGNNYFLFIYKYFFFLFLKIFHFRLSDVSSKSAFHNENLSSKYR